MANNYTIKPLKYDKFRANIGTPATIKRGANEGITENGKRQKKHLEAFPVRPLFFLFLADLIHDKTIFTPFKLDQ